MSTESLNVQSRQIIKKNGQNVKEEQKQKKPAEGWKEEEKRSEIFWN